MDNQHNPIARIIEEMQRQWVEATDRNPDYKLIRWMVKPENTPLMNGFYKLESSPYGALSEFFLVMLTPFLSFKSFSSDLLTHWTEAWEQDEAVKETEAEWDTVRIRQELAVTDDPDGLLVYYLGDFKERFCAEDQSFVFTLVPGTVSNIDHLNYWIEEIAEKLPSGVKLCVTDDPAKDYHKTLFKKYKEHSITLDCAAIDMHQAARQMLTAGKENDPAANFRDCVFRMGDAVGDKNEDRVHKWGKKAVEIAQHSGIKSFLASAYLVYAGFLMHLKKEETNKLLDKGIIAADAAFREEDIQATGILLQLYGFKAAYARIRSRKKEAVEWMMKQARFAVEQKMGSYAISSCRMAAQTAKSAWDNEHYYESLQLGWKAAEELANDELQFSEIGIIAFHYIKELRKEKETDLADRIGKRMVEIQGEGWDEDIPDITDKSGQTMPNLDETLQTLTTPN